MRKLAFYIFSILSFNVLQIGVLSAQSGNTLDSQMEKIRELFDNDMFVAVEKEIDATISAYPQLEGLNRSELESFRVFSAIMLKRPNIDALVMEFEDNYKYAPEFARVKFYQSKYYFDVADYPRSLDILHSIQNNNLSKTERLEFIFNRAYCNMRVGNNIEAVSGFEKILSFDSNPFTPSATYYLAYIYYLNKQFNEAIPLFLKLVHNGEYSIYSRYFLLESYLMLKNYEYVIKNGVDVYNGVNDELKGKTARIISEAYFAANKKEEAKKYFELYSKSVANLTPKDNYYLGVVSYSLHSYMAAVDAFSRMASTEDSLGQSGYYHMGNAYLQLKNKHGAMEAYKSAASSSFDNTITEEASFQYAKLLFDLNSDISAFERYLTNYPSSGKSDEIFNYIATSYLLSKKYKEAISALNSIRYLTPQMTLNLQKAAFFRAIQLFESGAYQDAITNFKNSINNGGYNDRLLLLAQFWMAETYYRSNNFTESTQINTRLLNNSTFRSSSEYPLSIFNLGYCYFRQFDFQNAIIWFTKYLNSGSTTKALSKEAKTRLADSYYMQKNYQKAAEIYSSINDTYSAYQCAMSYGLISNDAKKIEILKRISDSKSKSPYYSMAVYELGRTYVLNDETEKAQSCFNSLLKNVRDSLYYTKSLLELGMLSSNQGQYNKAIDYFRTIIEDAPLSEDSRSALAGIESIYQIQNRPDEYLEYIESLGMSELKSADEREMMLFNSAEQIFLSERYSQAYEDLSSFIKKYPSGSKTPQAYFYLGRTLVNMGKKEDAADAFRKVMEIGDGSFAELSTFYYATISYELEKYNNAIDAFSSLYDIAILDNNKKESLLGLMRSYYRKGDFDNANKWAANVFASEKGRRENSTEAKYIMAKSLLALGKRDEAIPVLKTLSKDNIQSEGAEAAYLLIQDAYDEGNFPSVENQVYAFSDSKSPQAYWLAKSFIVLGDSFAERGEWEQAKATFQSIKDGYSPTRNHDDVLEQVDMRLKRLESQMQNR